MILNIINNSNNELPTRASRLSACMDVRAFILGQDKVIIFRKDNSTFKVNDFDPTIGIRLDPMERAIVPTGLTVDIPEGYELALYPRSGLSITKGITLVNCRPVIDADFVDPIGILLVNLSDTSFYIKNGERLCQMGLKKVEYFEWNVVDEINKDKDRGGGLGHTGVK